VLGHLQHRPQRTGGRLRRVMARLSCACVIAASVAPAPAPAQGLNVQLEQQASQQYKQLIDQARAKNALATPRNVDLQRLRGIQERILPYTYAVNPRAKQWDWEVNLLRSEQINAFCMPGGKIAFYSAIITKLNLSDDEIAIVMGHEITHALKEHGVEQMKKQLYGTVAARAGGALVSAWLGIDPNLTDLAARGANSLLQLRFSRGDEAEADAVGLELAARAGFDPRAGVALWRKMAQASKGAPPQWLSSHPADANRIADIERRLPLVLPLYAQAVGKPVTDLPPYRSGAIVASPASAH
jgi:predicted Zn-dependent protease